MGLNSAVLRRGPRCSLCLEAQRRWSCRCRVGAVSKGELSTDRSAIRPLSSGLRGGLLRDSEHRLWDEAARVWTQVWTQVPPLTGYAPWGRLLTFPGPQFLICKRALYPPLQGAGRSKWINRHEALHGGAFSSGCVFPALVNVPSAWRSCGRVPRGAGRCRRCRSGAGRAAAVGAAVGSTLRSQAPQNRAREGCSQRGPPVAHYGAEFKEDAREVRKTESLGV